MKIRPIRTRVFCPPQHDLLKEISHSIKNIPEKSILVVTSKVVSIWQGRCIPASAVLDKDQLIISEAEKYLPREAVPGKWVIHTIKNNLFIPSSGIDESNANGHYILWPEKPYDSAKKILTWLKKNYKVKECGVLITDSHSIPLRRGVVGISLGYAGFAPLRDYRKSKDIFDREMKISQANIPDAISAGAVLCMGEGKEQTPFAVVTDIPFVSFSQRSLKRDAFSSFEVPFEQDLYVPFLMSVPWKKGGK